MSQSPFPPSPSFPPALPQAARGPTNGMAIASLVLGIVALVGGSCVTALPGVILGHMALRQIDASGGTQGGRGMAIGGLVTGYIALGLTLLAALGFALAMLLGIGAAAVSA
jgi:hypothetical protein